MHTNKPHRWVVVEITSAKYGKMLKVFAGWYGGLAYGDSWKLNSGITSFTKTDHSFTFNGYSKSVYECHRGCYGMNLTQRIVLDGWLEQGNNIRILELAEVDQLVL